MDSKPIFMKTTPSAGNTGGLCWMGCDDDDEEEEEGEKDNKGPCILKWQNWVASFPGLPEKSRQVPSAPCDLFW